MRQLFGGLEKSSIEKILIATGLFIVWICGLFIPTDLDFVQTAILVGVPVLIGVLVKVAHDRFCPYKTSAEHDGYFGEARGHKGGFYPRCKVCVELVRNGSADTNGAAADAALRRDGRVKETS